ncbi:hypothetical protein D3C81_2301010 [compost metagenome]
MRLEAILAEGHLSASGHHLHLGVGQAHLDRTFEHAEQGPILALAHTEARTQGV